MPKISLRGPPINLKKERKEEEKNHPTLPPLLIHSFVRQLPGSHLLSFPVTFARHGKYLFTSDV